MGTPRMEEQSASELGADRWGQSAMWKVGWSWAVVTAWVRARNQGVSSALLQASQTPALTLRDWTVVALVMPVPIFWCFW